MICPECKCEVNEDESVCQQCGFDLAMYKSEYERIYNEKLARLNKAEKSSVEPKIIYTESAKQTQNVHKPRCPYCNSDNLTKITSFDKAVNIAMFGLLGNKRKYQWHCNNCKTNW